MFPRPPYRHNSHSTFKHSSLTVVYTHTYVCQQTLVHHSLRFVNSYQNITLVKIKVNGTF